MSKSIGVVIFKTILLSVLSITLSKDYNKNNNVPHSLSQVRNKYENLFFNDTDVSHRRFLSKRSPEFQRNSEPDKIKTGRLSTNSEIRYIIRQNIKQWMPVLDDNKSREGKNKDFPKKYVALASQDIVNKKYKTLRKDVEKLLSIEPISSKTKLIMIEALDQIENQLKDNGCVIKNIKEDVTRRRHSRAQEPSIVIPKDLGYDEIIFNDIREKWDKVVNQYSMEDATNNKDKFKKVAFLFLTRLRQFVFDIHEDYTKLQDRFKIKCSSDKRLKVPIFKQSNINKLEQDDACSDLTICSLELLDFIADFYNQLNTTYTETIKNYIVMYIKEVNANSAEKESFKDILKLSLDHGRIIIQKMVTKELENLREGLNGTSTKTDGLKNFIDRTINMTKKLIYNSLTTQLKKLKPQLRHTVKQDISTSAGIELGNLQNIIKIKMCDVFRTCNGDITLRRVDKIRLRSIDPNDIKTRLRVQDVKEHQKLSGRRKNLLKSGKANARKLYEIKSFYIHDYKNNVTRTTYAGYIEKSTSKLMGDSSQTQKNLTRKTYAQYIEKGTPKLMGDSPQKQENLTRKTYAEYIEKGTTKLMGDSSQTQENLTRKTYAEYIEKGTTKLMGNPSGTQENLTRKTEFIEKGNTTKIMGNPSRTHENLTRKTYAEYIEKGTTKLMGDSSQTQENLTRKTYAEYIEKGTTKVMGIPSRTQENLTRKTEFIEKGDG